MIANGFTVSRSGREALESHRTLNGASRLEPPCRHNGDLDKSDRPGVGTKEKPRRQAGARVGVLSCILARRPVMLNPRVSERLSRMPMPTTASPALIPSGPLRLTDDQLAAVLRAAEPLAVGDRGAFLQDVAAALQGQELGDGTVYRVVAQVQRKYCDPPLVTAGPRWGR
jgi:hypothetical protein